MGKPKFKEGEIVVIAKEMNIRRRGEPMNDLEEGKGKTDEIINVVTAAILNKEKYFYELKNYTGYFKAKWLERTTFKNVFNQMKRGDEDDETKI